MELKPCPLCGSKAHIEKGLLGTYGVICKCSSHLFYDHEYDKYGAARLWNTRAERTCRVESMHGYTDPFVSTRYSVELSCHTLEDWPESEPPEYCPWCGAKVVE